MKEIPEKEIRNKLCRILEKKSFDSPFLLPFLRSAFPINIKEKYPNYQKYIIEIGSGWGEFAIQYAESHPNEMVLALEKKKNRILRAVRDQTKKKVENIQWMLVDVNWFFDEIFASQSFDKVIINFPDPWPKKRHHKHRFFTKNFLDSLTRVTGFKADIEFVSDDWPYIEESLFLLEDSPSWVNSHGPCVVLKERKKRIITFYQKEQKRSGKNVYHLEFNKK